MPKLRMFKENRKGSMLSPNSDIPCLYLPAELPCRPRADSQIRSGPAQCGLGMRSIRAIWYGLTKSCISISKLNSMGHVQLCHLSFHFNFFATVCNVKLKIYTCNCHFLQALTPPQVMIINMKK